MEKEIGDGVYRSTQEPEGGKGVPCPLRPAPLFRSIGLTGLSASLPPHRRLRPILHRARAVLPANAGANDTTESWSRGLNSGSNADTLLSEAAERGLPLKDRKCSEGDNNSLPGIMTQKLCPSQTHQETRSRRGSHSVGKTEILVFSSFQAQIESRLKPNNMLTDKILDLTSTAQRRHSTGHDPPSKIHVSRRTIVFPLTQSETYLSNSVTTAERPASTNRKRWRRIISNAEAFSQSEQLLTSDDVGEEDISQWFHNLAITDGEKDCPSASKKDSQVRGSSKLREPNRKASELESEREGKWACHTRRDRRPHFLPPISQLGCLLGVPLVLPENSPPPSPSSVSSAPFFPLSVPAVPLCLPRGERDTQDT